MSVEKDRQRLQDRIDEDLIDSIDEELELEIDDDRMARVIEHVTDSSRQDNHRPPIDISRSCCGCRASW